MSISINLQPSIIQPVYNTAYINIASPQSGQFNFHYVFDVYVQTATTATNFNNAFYGRYPLLPRYPAQNCLFSPNRIIESTLSYDLTQNQISTSASTNCARYYMVNIGQQSGSTITSAVTSYSGFVLNAVSQYMDLPSWNYQNEWRTYWMTGNTSQFLTDQPSSVYIRDNERCSVSFLNYANMAGSTGIKPSYILMTTYQMSGGSLPNFIYNRGTLLPASATTLNANFLVNHFGCGIWNLNNLPNSDVFFGITGATKVNVNTDYKYEIVLVDDVVHPTELSETITFVIDKRCTKYTPIRFMFLNRLGCFDYFTAILLSRNFIDVNKKSFNKYLQPNYAIGTRGQTVFDIKAIESVSISSDWVSDSESVWLQELFTSTEVYELMDDGTILPVIIDNKNIEVKKLVNDKLINYEFNYTYAFEIATQRS